MALTNLFIRSKHTIGGIELDSTVLEIHDSSVEVTRNPVEAGVDVADHAIIQPDSVFVKGVVTDTPLGLAAFGEIIDPITNLFGTSTVENNTRSKNAYARFKALKNRREKFTLVTGLEVYNNMLLTFLHISQDKDTSKVAILEMTFDEILTTTSRVESLTETDVNSDISKSITPTVQRGVQEALPVENESSLLFDIGDALGLFGG